MADIQKLKKNASQVRRDIVRHVSDAASGSIHKFLTYKSPIFCTESSLPARRSQAGRINESYALA